MADSQLTWFVGRGSGIVAYLLLTATVVLGIALSRRWHSTAWPRLVVHEAHRWATISFYLFLAMHITMMLLDSYVGFTVTDVLVPFATITGDLAESRYRRRRAGVRSARACGCATGSAIAAGTSCTGWA